MPRIVSLHFEHQAVARPKRMARHGIGYVPEGRGMFLHLAMRENLVMSYFAAPGRRNDWIYERVLDSFPRLTERLDNGGNQLSGGE